MIMRAVMIGDILALARVLRGQTQRDWDVLCHRAFYETHCADKCRKRARRIPLGWGDGSLMAWCFAGRFRRGAADLADWTFCKALAFATEKLLEWRDSQACRAHRSREIEE